MRSTDYFEASEGLTALAADLGAKQTSLQTARSEIIRGFSGIDTTWEGSYANDVLPAKDTWLAALSGVDAALATAVTVIGEWAERTYDVGVSVQTIERNIEWYEVIRDPDTGRSKFADDITTATADIARIAVEWSFECAAFCTRFHDSITTLTNASGLESIPGGPISGPQYYVQMSYLIQYTGVDIALVDPEGEFDKASAAILELLRSSPELFTALDVLTDGSVDLADNSWGTLNFERARNNPELVALVLQQYSMAYDLDWSEAEIEAMVSQLVVFGAVLMTSESDAIDDFDNEWVDPRVETKLRDLVAEVQTEGGHDFEIWINEHYFPHFEDWWEVGDDPSRHVRLLAEYARYIEYENLSMWEKAQRAFRENVFDYTCFYGENADLACAAWQVTGVLPWGALATGLKFARYADEGAEAIDTATDIARGTVRHLDDELIDVTLDGADDIAENALDTIDEVDVLEPKPGTDVVPEREPALVGANGSSTEAPTSAADTGDDVSPSSGGNDPGAGNGANVNDGSLAVPPAAPEPVHPHNDPPAPMSDDSGPGSWVAKNENMPDSSAEFQAAYAGGDPTTMAYRVNDVDFDGLSEQGVLIDTKNQYAQFLDPDTGGTTFESWWGGGYGQNFVRQAQRQIDAADGTPIRWIFREPEAAAAVETLLENAGLDEIEIVVRESLP